ncbi:MAG: RluA family pseudouridine synthase [Eubacteriales bacterium]|nr:RluA family pseudouridine synthase [Eubacteriales bacterium]
MLDNKIIKYTNKDKIRLDSYLAAECSDMSRSRIQKMIKDADIKVNNAKVKSGYMLSEGDEIELTISEPEEINIKAEDIPLDIVYEDDDVIIVNKPKNMVVHPANGHYSGTLVNALMYHCKDSLSGINGELRPGIVHRIDKDTTGLLIACKNDKAHNSIAMQLSEHSITRRYLALCYGNIKEDSGVIDKRIDRSDKDRKKMAVTTIGRGREAITHYRVIERFGDATLVECRLETGRTHQIRVHMSYIKHPLLGDETYGIKKENDKANGQYLHAAVLGFIHPTTHEYMEFTAPLPDYFLKKLRQLGSRLDKDDYIKQFYGYKSED